VNGSNVWERGRRELEIVLRRYGIIHIPGVGEQFDLIHLRKRKGQETTGIASCFVAGV
jgi:hypothetical protein